jgi:hypothetical protein
MIASQDSNNLHQVINARRVEAKLRYVWDIDDLMAVLYILLRQMLLVCYVSALSDVCIQYLLPTTSPDILHKTLIIVRCVRTIRYKSETLTALYTIER